MLVILWQSERGNKGYVSSETVYLETETSAEFIDELDHIVLKERLKRLLTRKPSGLMEMPCEARYLQFRNWPVEWGWCRDLQSFIFVFERHNRIVLELPEYGYEAYFFELAESLPINWQIKRLVTAMKLTSCSRITLLENKARKVGDDLSEGEAKVLTEYGWTPDTGLGTMLNYYDRVHDRKTVSEWRSKIGKLLMDGYNGGTVVCASIPRKVVIEYNVADVMQI